MHVIIFILMRQATPTSTSAMERVLEREEIVVEMEGDDVAVARALRTGADFRTALVESQCSVHTNLR